MITPTKKSRSNFEDINALFVEFQREMEDGSPTNLNHSNGTNSTEKMDLSNQLRAKQSDQEPCESISRRYSLLSNYGLKNQTLSSIPSFNITRSPSLTPSINSTPKRQLYVKQRQDTEEKTPVVPKGYDEDPLNTHDKVVRKLSMRDNFPSCVEISKEVEKSEPIQDLDENEDFSDLNPEQLKEELKRMRKEKKLIEAKNSTLESYYHEALSKNALSQMTLDQVRSRSRYRQAPYNDGDSMTSSNLQLNGPNLKSSQSNNFIAPIISRSRSGSIGLSKWSSNRDLFQRKMNNNNNFDQIEQASFMTSGHPQSISSESRDINFKSDDPEERLNEIEKRINYFFTKYTKRGNKLTPDYIRSAYSGLCKLQEAYYYIKEEIVNDDYLSQRKASIIYRVDVTMKDAENMLNDAIRKSGIKVNEQGSMFSLTSSQVHLNNNNNCDEAVSSVSSLASSQNGDFPEISRLKNNIEALEQHFELFIDRYKKTTGLPKSQERDRRIERLKESLLFISSLVHPTEKMTTIVSEEQLKVYFLSWEKKHLFESHDPIDIGEDINQKLEKLVCENIDKIQTDIRHHLVGRTDSQTSSGPTQSYGDSGLSLDHSKHQPNGYHSKVHHQRNEMPPPPQPPMNNTENVISSHQQNSSHLSNPPTSQMSIDSNDFNNDDTKVERSKYKNMLRTFEQEPDSSTISQETKISLNSLIHDTNPIEKFFREPNNNTEEEDSNENHAMQKSFKQLNVNEGDKYQTLDPRLSSSNNNTSQNRSTRGVSLRHHDGLNLPVEHQISSLNSIRQNPIISQPAVSSSRGHSNFSEDIKSLDHCNEYPCINDKFCKLWLLRALKNYNQQPRAILKDGTSIHQKDFDLLAREICGYCDGSLAEDLNNTQSQKTNEQTCQVIHHGARESPLSELDDIKSMDYQQRMTDRSKFATTDHLRMPIRHYEAIVDRHNDKGAIHSARAYNMKELSSYSTGPRNNSTTSQYPSQTTISFDDRGNTTAYQQMVYSQTSANLFNIHQTSSHENLLDGQHKSSFTSNPSLRKSLRPPSIYEGVNDPKTLSKSQRLLPRSRSTNQIERHYSTSESSPSSPGVDTRQNSRFSKILSDAQTITMLAQDFHKTLLSVKQY